MHSLMNPLLKGLWSWYWKLHQCGCDALLWPKSMAVLCSLEAVGHVEGTSQNKLRGEGPNTRGALRVPYSPGHMGSDIVSLPGHIFLGGFHCNSLQCQDPWMPESVNAMNGLHLNTLCTFSSCAWRTCDIISWCSLSGRYLFLNAIANQLRYPNSHTHYFSCTLLYLFAEANTEAIQEQITR
jgi:hypothetical protein